MATPPLSVLRNNAANDVATYCRDAFIDQASAFTCREAEVIAEFLRLFADDGDRIADVFMAAHAEGDEEGDEHA